MTTDNMNNFAASLVEMAKAHEQMPHLKAKINELERDSITDGDHIASLQIKLIQKEDEITSLIQKLRSVEAERDDAGFRHLEAEDKISALTQSLRTVFSSVGETLKAAQPVSVPMHEAQLGATYHTPQASPGEPAVSDPGALKPAVVSVSVDPTVDQHASTIGTTTPSEHMFATEPLPDTGHGIYHGKLYYDMPHYIPNTSWLDNGGTQADYDWRPNRSVNF